MYCMKCGKQCDNNQKFCIGCGNPLTAPAINNSMVQNNEPIQQPILPVVSNQPVEPVQNQMSQPVNNQPIRQKKKGSGCLIFLLIFIGLIVGIFIFFSLIFKSEEKETIQEFAKDYKYLSVVNQEEIMINNAKEDITFYVTSDTTYTIVDSNGILVPTEIKDNQIVNNNKYIKGETYTLTLQSGKFVSNQLTGSSKVSFKIARDEVQKYEFKDKLIKVKSSDIIVSEDESTFTSNEAYEVGNVIAVNKNDVISEAYVVLSASDGVYQIRKAQLNEIYKELNFYVEQPADLSNYKVAAQIEDYVAKSITESAWYDSLVEEVNAEPKVKVELSKIDNGIEAKTKITIKANESSPLVVSKYHDLQLVITNRLMVTQLIDITLSNWDVTFDITTEQDFEFTIENDALEYGDTFSEKKVNYELVKKVQKALENSEYTDTSENKMAVATVDIPTPVPCLTVEIDLKLAHELKASIELGIKTSQMTNVVVGFDYGLNENFKPKSSYEYDFKGVEISLTGKAEYKAGLEVSVTAEILNTVEAGVALGAGLYIEGETKIVTAIGKDSQFSVSLGYDTGLYIEGKLVAEFFGSEVEYSLFEQKLSLDSNEVEFVYPKLEESNEENVLMDENGMLVNKEENRLEQYSCVSSVEDDSFVKAQYIFENGQFKGVKVTEQVYINTGSEWADEFLKILAKIFTAYMFFENWTPIEYYEEGYYVYVTTTYTSEKWMEKNYSEYDSEKELNYNDFKVKMVEQGYTCK